MPHSTPEPTRHGLRVLPLLALALACALLVRYARTPSAPLAASAPAADFSAMRAMRHLSVIAQRPHPIGSPDAARVRDYLIASLDSLGFATEVQEVTAVGTRYQALGHVRNIVGRLRGTSSGGKAVLLMSHYDGVPAGPAASDAGSGVATILEVVRALRAGTPLPHDLIVLFTDGEESGLLGASAFVREHRWKDDVAVTLNFEARGTGGRVSMFETGPGNLDLIRVLRGAPEVSASSLAVSVYRTLNNDTDLSEVALLGQPALNFAFVDGVGRYHTTEDDTLHIDPGSLQQEGAQALAVVRALSAGPLPRPVTRDAVFSDVAPFGLIYYDEALARPLAVVLVVLFVGATVLLHRRERRWVRDALAGVLVMIVSLAAGGGIAFGAGALMTAVHKSTGGDPAYATPYVVAIIALAFAAAWGCWALARRWCRAEGLHHGILLIWTVLAVTASVQWPGASFLFAWPLAVMLPAVMVQGRWRAAAAMLAAYVALALLVPMIVTVGPVTLGMIGAGGIVTGVLVAVLALFIGPMLEALLPGRTYRLALGALALGTAAFAIGATTVRFTAAHPARSLLVYAADADSGGAWLAAPASTTRPGSWTAGVLGPSVQLAEQGDDGTPAWFATALPFRGRTAARAVPRLAIDGPQVETVSDSRTSSVRTLVLRVTAPSGAQNVTMRLTGARVRSAGVDGRRIDTTRFRRKQQDWSFSFSAPPDSGFVLGLALEPSEMVQLELASTVRGLPAMPGVVVPARPAGTVATQTGDVTAVRRVVRY